MNREDFYFYLPSENIAQTPILKRDGSLLMALNKETGSVEHLKFRQLINILKKGDCIVLNNSKVFPARLYGVNSKTNAKLEFLLVNEKEKDLWEVLARPAKRAKLNYIFNFSSNLKGKVVGEFKNGLGLLKFFYCGDFYSILNSVGNVPLPPYIREKLSDMNRYQTVYAKVLGSCAAPTAGLHFTTEMLEELEKKGVIISYVTLHVGLGTFLPVKEHNIEDHVMHSESYFLNDEEAAKINDVKLKGGRVYCVGTTSCRILESVYLKYGKICGCSGNTNIFIYPGFKFNVMDGLITNFHLPESTLIMLVSAFAGRENIINAYNEAIKMGYRFFSFGDAMLIF